MHLQLLVSNQIHSYVAAIASSTTAAMADTAINTVAAAGASSSLLQDVILSKFASNPLAVGAAWMVSSAIFTTYSTTKFIKYKKPTTATIRISDEQQHPFWVQQQQQRLVDRLRPLRNRLRRRYAAMVHPRKNVHWPFDSRNKKTNRIPPKDVTTFNQLSGTQQIQSESVPLDGGGDAPRTLSPSSLLTMYRFAGSLLFGLLFSTTSSSSIQQRFHVTMTTIPTLLIPSICLFIANFSNTYVYLFCSLDASIMTLSSQFPLLTLMSSSSAIYIFSIALDRIGIGLTYTSKCGIPIITVLLTLLLDGVGALPNIPTLLSLIPIAFGIAAASWSAPTYELLGFIMACISATAQSALNVTSKRAMARAKITGPIGQRTMVAVGLLFTVTINLIQIGMATIQRRRALSHPSSNQNDAPIRGKSQQQQQQQRVDTPPLWLTIMAMVAYHVEYLLSFIFVTLVGPITYGTCDAIRRLCIILFGRIFFGGDPFTKMNKMGIATALLGALSYSILNSN